MARTKTVVDLSTGVTSVVPLTPEEEAAADLAKQTDDQAQVPVLAEQARLNAIRINNRTTVLVNALTTKDDAGLIAAVAARYPGLTGDALKAVQDIALVMAYTYRNGG